MKASYRLYRDFFSPSECAMLDSCLLESAVSEINLIRVQLRRVLESRPASRPTRRRAGIGRSRGQEAAGPTALPLSKNRRFKSVPLQRHLAMLITFNTTGVVLASLVRYHRYSRHSGLFTDPVLEALAVDDISQV